MSGAGAGAGAAGLLLGCSRSCCCSTCRRQAPRCCASPPPAPQPLPCRLQVRTAELLRLHSELRQALFLAGGLVPSALLPRGLSLDLLRFLQLWDHEAGLSAQVGAVPRPQPLGTLRRLPALPPL
jgi:hypothetical protein